jgi:hypothetical protein
LKSSDKLGLAEAAAISSHEPRAICLRAHQSFLTALERFAVSKAGGRKENHTGRELYPKIHGECTFCEINFSAFRASRWLPLPCDCPENGATSCNFHKSARRSEERRLAGFNLRSGSARWHVPERPEPLKYCGKIGRDGKEPLGSPIVDNHPA